jgi:Flp pilus assembly protein TadB
MARVTHGVESHSTNRERGRKSQVFRALAIGVPIGVSVFYTAPLLTTAIVLAAMLLGTFGTGWLLVVRQRRHVSCASTRIPMRRSCRCSDCAVVVAARRCSSPCLTAPTF